MESKISEYSQILASELGLSIDACYHTMEICLRSFTPLIRLKGCIDKNDKNTKTKGALASKQALVKRVFIQNEYNQKVDRWRPKNSFSKLGLNLILVMH